MDTNSIIAYGLIFIGAVLVLFALYTGYNLYWNISATLSYGIIAPSVGSSNNLNVGGALNSLSALPTEMQLGVSLFAEIFLLFLFATIGFKLIELGMKLEKGPASGK